MTTDSKASDVEARERENFERVHAGKLHLDRLANGNYWSSITDDRWHGWLARASQQPSAQWIATPEASVAEVMDALAEMALPHSPDTERTEG